MPTIKKINLFNFFFTPFSEIELVSMFYLIFLLVIHRWEYLLSITGPSDIIFLWIVPVALLVFYNAISYRKVLKTESSIYAFSFYAIISIITIDTLRSLPDLNSASNRGNPLFDFMEIIEFLIIIYMFVKSFMRLVLIRFATDQLFMDIGNKMKKEQLRDYELILMVLFAPVIYLLLQSNNSISQVLGLSYFYLTSLINMSSKARKKLSILKSNNY